MTFWLPFWTTTLVVGIVLFVGLAVVVSIGGLADVRALFSSIVAQHDASSDDDS